MMCHIEAYPVVLHHMYKVVSTSHINIASHREFRDVVFEDVVLDNNSCVTLLSFVCIVTFMPNLLSSNTTSSNTPDHTFSPRRGLTQEGASGVESLSPYIYIYVYKHPAVTYPAPS